MKKLAITIALLIIGFVGWYLVSPLFIDNEIVESIPEEFIITTEKPFEEAAKTLTEVITSQPTENFSGDFEKVDYDVTGGFSILENNGKSLLRINNLDITNGPDLYLMLSNQKTASGKKELVIIDKLKANQGSFNVEIPEEINVRDYKYLLIHCKKFNHTFAAAEISMK